MYMNMCVHIYMHNNVNRVNGVKFKFLLSQSLVLNLAYLYLILRAFLSLIKHTFEHQIKEIPT